MKATEMWVYLDRTRKWLKYGAEQRVDGWITAAANALGRASAATKPTDRRNVTLVFREQTKTGQALRSAVLPKSAHAIKAKISVAVEQVAYYIARIGSTLRHRCETSAKTVSAETAASDQRISVFGSARGISFGERLGFLRQFSAAPLHFADAFSAAASSTGAESEAESANATVTPIQASAQEALLNAGIQATGAEVSGATAALGAAASFEAKTPETRTLATMRLYWYCPEFNENTGNLIIRQVESAVKSGTHLSIT
jgi:hypothetical protein